jgi:hypothetical protein
LGVIKWPKTFSCSVTLIFVTIFSSRDRKLLLASLKIYTILFSFSKKTVCGFAQTISLSLQSLMFFGNKTNLESTNNENENELLSLFLLIFQSLSQSLKKGF